MNESLYDLLALYVTQQSITNVSVTFVRMITERNDYFIIFFFWVGGGGGSSTTAGPASETAICLKISIQSIGQVHAQLQMLLLLPGMSISAALYLLD